MKLKVLIFSIFSLYLFPALADVSNVQKEQFMQPSESMQIFLDGCRIMKESIADHNSTLLSNASEMFEAIGVSELPPENFTIEDFTVASLTNPEIQFTSDGCDLIKISDFILIDREPIESLRSIGLPDELNVISRSIAPGANVKFTLEGAGNMEMAVPALIDGSLQIEVETDEGPVPVVFITDNNVPFASWQMSEELSPFVISVSNPTDKKVSFAIALK